MALNSHKTLTLSGTDKLNVDSHNAKIKAAAIAELSRWLDLILVDGPHDYRSLALRVTKNRDGRLSEARIVPEIRVI
jgi:hypothetical protein